MAAATQARAGARNDGADDSPADDDDDDDADSDSDGDTDSHDADAADPPSAANAVPIIDAYRLEPTDWSVRELCSDGGCIGVVHGGVCNACGRRSDG
ncbi:MAG: hypothetical protein KBG15_15915 [Kofleriaceae bacterium]|nr:hypothetical protein [Kofleriaceae bacterium]